MIPQRGRRGPQRVRVTAEALRLCGAADSPEPEQRYQQPGLHGSENPQLHPRPEGRRDALSTREDA